MASRRSLFALACLSGLAGCSAKFHANPTNGDISRLPPGTSSIHSSVPGLSLESASGTSVALVDTSQAQPLLQLRLSSGALSCVKTVEVDRLSIDFGSVNTGTFAVVTGYPAVTTLGATQARAHACPATSAGAPPQTNCDQQVRGGTIVVSRLDPDLGGTIEGTFDVVFADGEASGTYSATRCF